MGAYLYILRGADGSYYVGTTAVGLERRLAEHQAGGFDGYTALRRPVELVFHQHFDRLEDATAAERQVKGWRRDKKEFLIRGDFAVLPSLAHRGATAVRPSRRGPGAAPQHDRGLHFDKKARKCPTTRAETVACGARPGAIGGRTIAPKNAAIAMHDRWIRGTRDREFAADLLQRQQN
jgi:putative endonuclease